MRLRKDKRPSRVAQATERQAYWSALSAAEKIASLDARLGKGQGAKRQRARIIVSGKKA